MGKNIVLCADGTGNDGGTGSDTNVFKIYQAAKINMNMEEQIAYYDRGVGTSKNKFLRALGGGFGWGFRQNVRELYEYLGQHYKDDDEIYIFGFSRGAATVRAFAGMIEYCGLVTEETVKSQGNGDNPKIYTFDEMVEKAMESYKNRNPKGESEATLPFKTNRDVKIKFMGVWDTVSALGLPQIKCLDTLVNKLLHHHSYDFEPTQCVENVYHALSIDDERRTFRPLVWNKKNIEGRIEQVWFPGVHSNIGGGYPREGLANVTLDWMMEKLESEDIKSNIKLNKEYIDKAQKEANSHGKIYDSRSGYAIYYRYNPRHIEDLYKDKLKSGESIKIHESAFKRMDLKTEGYSPGNLPRDFEVVGTKNTYKPSMVNMAGNKDYLVSREKSTSFLEKRKCLYNIFFWSSILLVVASLYLWISLPDEIKFDQWICLSDELKNDQRNCPPVELDKNQLWPWVNGVLGHVADILRYVLPDIFEGAITFGVIQNPIWFLVVTIVFILMASKRTSFMEIMEDEQEKMRKELLNKWGGRQ